MCPCMLKRLLRVSPARHKKLMPCECGKSSQSQRGAVSIVVHTDSYLSNGWDIRAHPSRRNTLCGNSLLNYCIFTVYLGEHG